MDSNRSCLVALFLIAAGSSVPAHSQSLVMRDLGRGFQGAASLDLARATTDNYFFQQQSGVSSSGYFLRPNILVDRDSGSASFKLRAAGEYSKFDLPDTFSAYEDSYFDGLLSGGVDWTLGTRNRLHASAEYRKGHDALGTTATALTSVEADKWNQSALKGRYRLGAPEAAINVEFQAGSRDRTYTSNEATTRFLDFRTDTFGTTLFYNYSPKTALLADLEHVQTDFDESAPGSPRTSGSETRLSGGIQWKATAKTTGDIRLGFAQADFDTAEKRDFFRWSGSLIWNPASRTTFTFLTGRTAQETYLVSANLNAVSIDNRDYAAEWAQRWGGRITTYLSSRYVRSDFVGRSNIVRSDDVRSLVLSAEYSLVKYLVFIASANQTDRNSSVSTSNYENITTYFGVRIIP